MLYNIILLLLATIKNASTTQFSLNFVVFVLIKNASKKSQSSFVEYKAKNIFTQVYLKYPFNGTIHSL